MAVAQDSSDNATALAPCFKNFFAGILPDSWFIQGLVNERMLIYRSCIAIFFGFGVCCIMFAIILFPMLLPFRSRIRRARYLAKALIGRGNLKAIQGAALIF